MAKTKSAFYLLARNAVGNYAATIWLAALPLALLPVYIRVLGPEQWGLIAVCMTAQGLMNLLDLGLSQIMPRDIARAGHDAHATARSYHTYAAAYGLLGVAGGALGCVFALWAAASWSPLPTGSVPGTSAALALVSTQLAFQLANNANLGYWNGLQRQNQANLRQCLFHTTKHCGALGMLLATTPSAIAYLLPFVGVGALEWWANRRSIMSELRPAQLSLQERLDDLRHLVRSTGAIGVSIVVGMLAAQADRVILFSLLDLAEFGRYVAVATLGLGFFQLQYPLMRALQPHIVLDARRHGSSRIFLLVAVVVGLPCFVVAAVAEPLLATWLGAQNLPAGGALLLQLIVLAVALNSLYAVTYLYILKRGDGRYLILTNLTVLVASVFALLLAAPSFGPVAGGLAWLTGAATQLLFGWAWTIFFRPITFPNND